MPISLADCTPTECLILESQQSGEIMEKHILAVWAGTRNKSVPYAHWSIEQLETELALERLDQKRRRRSFFPLMTRERDLRRDRHDVMVRRSHERVRSNATAAAQMYGIGRGRVAAMVEALEARLDEVAASHRAPAQLLAAE